MAQAELVQADERRKHFRTPMNRPAELRFQIRVGIYGCTVLDESDGGLQVDLDREVYIPTELIIRFSDGASKLVRRCWFSGTRAGLQFIDFVEAEPQHSRLVNTFPPQVI